MKDKEMSLLTVSFSNSSEIKGNAHGFFYSAEGEFRDIEKFICSKPWSPIVWKDGKRAKKNFKQSQLMAFDFDTGEWTLDDAKNFCEQSGLNAIIATSKSHQKEKHTEAGEIQAPCDRFRMVIEAPLCTNMDDFEYTMKVMIHSMPCDNSCKDAARFYYPCKEIYYTRFDGSMAQWLACPEEVTEEIKFRKQLSSGKANWRNPAAIAPWIQNSLRFGVKSPGRHKEVYKISCQLTCMGFEEYEILQLLHNYKSPLLEIGVTDAERCITNGRVKVEEQREAKKGGAKS